MTTDEEQLLREMWCAYTLHATPKPFRVRETRAGVLRPGQATVLTRQRDGMHTFRGGAAGGSVVDFTLSLTDDIETFSYVELAPKPIDAERRTWEAKWLGKRR